MNVAPSSLIAAYAAQSSEPAPSATGAAAAPQTLRNPAASEAAPAGMAFADVLRDYLGDIQTQQTTADQSIARLATGDADQIHDVVLTAVKADMSARMLFEIRNQLVDAYREVMRMQL